MDNGLWDQRGSSALDEIQERLAVIYNKIRQAKDDKSTALQVAAISDAEIERLERVANEYVALLVPEGNPA